MPITPASDGCGNNLVIAPETCDDGKTEKFDFCDSDCIADFCQGPTVTQQVTFTVSNPNVAAVTLHVDYPEGEIILPGTGTGATVTPTAGTAEVNDFDHALRLVVFDLFNFGTTSIATAQFETCNGGTPTPGEFTCTVVDAGDENLAPVAGVTCAVTIP